MPQDMKRDVILAKW